MEVGSGDEKEGKRMEEWRGLGEERGDVRREKSGQLKRLIKISLLEGEFTVLPMLRF